MKILYNTIFCFLLAIIICSCSSDDRCTADDWSGRYSADATCTLSYTAISADTTVTLPMKDIIISKLDEQTLIMDDGGLNNPEIDISECEIVVNTDRFSGFLEGFGVVNFELDGDQITGTSIIDIDELNIICDMVFSRQL